MAGMNALFTRNFFAIARSRLNPGGVLAQWFHLYNMESDDLRSFLRAFIEVFPSAILWQLNEGDMLITGFNRDHGADSVAHEPGPAAAADMRAAGVTDAEILSTLYVMQGADLASFSAGIAVNTDDGPMLEFHGQRNLHLQTDEGNAHDLAAFPCVLPQPKHVNAAWAQATPALWLARGIMFEKAESCRLASESFGHVGKQDHEYTSALDGMIRCARTPGERDLAGTLETRTKEAPEAARAGRRAEAEILFTALTQAYQGQPGP
ncbi:MAG: hypothetical protein QOJ99_4652 [Bryobacterales bacterium]|jgi:hypothetical protein|nr:hypothetical protein [Bryobacterales bacterium]